MKIIRCIAVIAFLIALQAPVFAGWTNLRDSAADRPTFVIDRPKDMSWTASIPRVPVVKNEVPVRVDRTTLAPDQIYRPVAPRGTWAERPNVIVNNDYIKTDMEMRSMRPTIDPKFAAAYGVPVPEPGSIFGLSAGLFGVLLQARRMRKRS
ncbi:MAG TPA: PEP-CTERM sorting domain-containing protein [Armatimonadota bacterium]|jgi:hypothetical protein|nr:PEP-CTERM sorting domain-containing protein [Armatimonadota bacterium]HOM71232.1 PEP-CTERM sorting domain-containing protein [Armatimonadota bacterium]